MTNRLTSVWVVTCVGKVIAVVSNQPEAERLVREHPAARVEQHEIDVLTWENRQFVDSMSAGLGDIGAETKPDWVKQAVWDRLDERDHACPSCGAKCRCEVPEHCGHCA
jgi:hypothetical protein